MHGARTKLNKTNRTSRPKYHNCRGKWIVHESNKCGILAVMTPPHLSGSRKTGESKFCFINQTKELWLHCCLDNCRVRKIFGKFRIFLFVAERERRKSGWNQIHD